MNGISRFEPLLLKNLMISNMADSEDMTTPENPP